MPTLEKPRRSTSSVRVVPITLGRRYAAIALALLLLLGWPLGDLPFGPFYLAISIIMVVGSFLRDNSRYLRPIMVLGLFALSHAGYVLGSSATGTFAVIAVFMLTALLGNTWRKTALALLTFGATLCVLMWMSFTYGRPYAGQPVSFEQVALCCVFGFATALPLSRHGWLRTLNGAGRLNRRLRQQCAAAIVGPWIFGLILYRGVGVSERVVDAEKLMIAVVIFGLLMTISKFGQTAIEEEKRRKADLQNWRDAAETDVLTGLPNRAGILSSLNVAWEDYVKSQRGSAIIIFDLDHFKSVNDSFGHDGGDLVLSAIGDAVKPYMRAGDMIGRWGGEEFLCVLRGAKGHQLQFVAERLRSAIEELTVPLSKQLGAPCLISASFGVARFSEFDHCPMEVVTRADKALYQSKTAGRNRVSLGGTLNFSPSIRSVSKV